MGSPVTEWREDHVVGSELEAEYRREDGFRFKGSFTLQDASDANHRLTTAATAGPWRAKPTLR